MSCRYLLTIETQEQCLQAEIELRHWNLSHASLESIVRHFVRVMPSNAASLSMLLLFNVSRRCRPACGICWSTLTTTAHLTGRFVTILQRCFYECLMHRAYLTRQKQAGVTSLPMDRSMAMGRSSKRRQQRWYSLYDRLRCFLLPFHW